MKPARLIFMVQETAENKETRHEKKLGLGEIWTLAKSPRREGRGVLTLEGWWWFSEVIDDAANALLEGGCPEIDQETER